MEAEIEELLQTSSEDYVHALLQLYSSSEQLEQPSAEQPQSPSGSKQPPSRSKQPSSRSKQPPSPSKQHPSPFKQPPISVDARPKRQKRSGKFTTAKLQSREYSLQFKGNGSQQWDGKVINVDAEWLEELYNQEILFPGRVVELPWKGRKGVDVQWRGTIVSMPEGEFLAPSHAAGYISGLVLKSGPVMFMNLA